MSQIYSFSKDTYYANITHWVEIIKRGECGSLLDYSSLSQSYRIEEFLADHQTLAKHFSGKNTVSFIKCNLELFLLSDVKALEIFLNTSVDQNNRSVVFILNADTLLTEKPEWLAYLYDYLVERPNISMLFFFKKNITAPFYLQTLSHFSVLFQNIVIKRPYTAEDVRGFIVQLQQVFGASIPEDISEKILLRCKNKLGLIKEAVRYYAKTQDEEHLFDHEEMVLQLQAILNEYEPWEFEVIQKVAREDFVFTQDEQSIVEYLIKTGVLEQKGVEYIIAVPLVQEHIEAQQAERIHIFLDSKQNIIVNKVSVNEMFSRSEREMFRFLLQNQNTLITRERLGKVIWKGEYHMKYSDWALDQMVKRFREKILKLGISKKLLQTKKNQGFIFSCSV